MFKRQMKLLAHIAVILPCAMLGACSTPQTRMTVDTYCINYRPIQYTLVPRAERDAAVAAGRVVRDDGNMADSDATRARIGEENAKWRGVCGQLSSNP